MIDQFVGEMLDSHFHNIGCIDCTNDAGPVKGPLAILYTGGLEIRHHGEILPDFSLEAVLCELLTKDCIGFTDCFQTVTSNGTGAAYTKAGAGEGLTIHHICGQAELVADHADFIFKEDPDGLYQLKAGRDIFRKTACIVMCLDSCFALKNIRPDGSLCQEFHTVKLSGFFGKDIDKFFANNVSLLLRIGNTCELVKETIHRVNIDQICIHLVPEDLDDLLRLALAQKAMIDMHANELLADRLDQKRGDNRGINTAGEGEQNLLITDLLFQGGNLFVDKRFGKLRGSNSFHGFRTSFSHCNLPLSEKSENRISGTDFSFDRFR